MQSKIVFLTILAIATSQCAESIDDRSDANASNGNRRFSLDDTSEVKQVLFDDNGTSRKLISAKQFQQRIWSCLGNDLTMLHPWHMIELNDPDELRGFLVPGTHPITEDIVDLYQTKFDGPKFLQASSTRNAELTLDYFVAQQTVANVVAYNCHYLDLASDQQRCRCNNAESVQNMLLQCFPTQTVNDTFETVAAEVLTMCEESEVAAIASLVGSLSFISEP